MEHVLLTLQLITQDEILNCPTVNITKGLTKLAVYKQRIHVIKEGLNLA